MVVIFVIGKIRVGCEGKHHGICHGKEQNTFVRVKGSWYLSQERASQSEMVMLFVMGKTTSSLSV